MKDVLKVQSNKNLYKYITYEKNTINFKKKTDIKKSIKAISAHVLCYLYEDYIWKLSNK